MSNPYASPDADVGGPQPAATTSFRFFSPPQVAAGAFLGSPIAAGWMIGHNFRNLGDSRAGAVSWLLGTLATVALIVVFYLPDEVPILALPAAYTIGAYVIAQRLQGSAFDRHVQRGGQKGSVLLIVAGSLGFAATAAGVLAILAFLTDTSVQVGPGQEIFYDGEATETDARHLARCLEKQSYFEDGGEIVFLNRDGAGYGVGFSVVTGAWLEPEAREYYRTLAFNLHVVCFRGGAVTVELLNVLVDKRPFVHCADMECGAWED